MTKVLGMIPARAGSLRVVGKNIKLCGGKPLIAWTIEIVLESNVTDRLIVTTDSPEIADIAKGYGADVPELRPAELALSEVPLTGVMRYMIDQFGEGYDVLANFLPTSPLRQIADIEAAFRLLYSHQKVGAVITVAKINYPPQAAVELDSDNRVMFRADYPFDKNSQESTPRYSINGVAMLVRIPYFKVHGWYGPNVFACVTSDEASVDVDTEFEFWQAEQLLSQRHTNAHLGTDIG